MQAKRVIFASMDQWTGTLSKMAPQSRLCVKSWTISYSDVALNGFGKPPAGQDMRQRSGHLHWQITKTMWSAHEETMILLGPPIIIDSRSKKGIKATSGISDLLLRQRE